MRKAINWIQSMSSLPEVSVIIPTYNRAHMLGDALRSVLGQSFTDFELIVVDDGSTDDTESLLSSWTGRLEVIKTNRRGVSASRNLGAQQAHGRWLAFLDSDDLWLPEKLELQLEAHHQQPEFLISHTDEFWVRRGVRVNPMKKHAKLGGRIFEYCLPMCRISPSSVLIDRGLFSRIGGFDQHYRVCEDYESLAADYRAPPCALYPQKTGCQAWWPRGPAFFFALGFRPLPGAGDTEDSRKRNTYR